jgi:hypothetical protein
MKLVEVNKEHKWIIVEMKSELNPNFGSDLDKIFESLKIKEYTIENSKLLTSLYDTTWKYLIEYELIS